MADESPRFRRFRASIPLLLAYAALGMGGDFCGSTAPDHSNVYTLDLTVNGQGTIAVDSAGQTLSRTCDSHCSYTFQDESGVALEATPKANYTFGSWGGVCSIGSGTRIFFYMIGDAVCEANFNVVQAPPGANDVVIEDDFTTAKIWTTAVIQSTGNPTAPQTATTQATGGNPGAFRQMTHTFSTAGDIWVNHIFGSATYNPQQQGAITSIDYAEDQAVLSGPFLGAAVAGWFIIIQNGQSFERALNPNAFSSTTWVRSTLSGLTPASFAPAPGPNFSATGAPMQFGYRRANTNTSASAQFTITHAIDNWRVTIRR